MRITLLILLLLSACPLWAQQEVLYSQYLTNPLAINPAVAGSRESFMLTGMLRRKWFGVRGAPVTQSFAADGTVANGRVGLGFQALNDRMGFFNTTGIYGSVAYRFALPALARLSVGVQGGVNILPFQSQNSSTLNQTQLSLGVGVYYKSDRFFVGVSMPELAGKLPGLVQSGAVVRLPGIQPVMVQVGVPLSVGDNAMLIPSVLVSKLIGTAARPVGVDLNLQLWLQEQIGFGLSYRYNTPGLIQTNYLYAQAQYQLTKALRLSYQFYSQTPENPNASLYFQTSVHEIGIRFSPNTLTFTR